MQTFGEYLISGIAQGAVYALIALGITLVYGLTRIVNFAVGEFVAVGALVAWSVHEATGSFALALLAVAPTLAVMGLLTERLAFRWTLEEPIGGFVVSLGLILFLQAFAIEVWGADERSVSPPVSGVVAPLGLTIRNQTLLNTGIALVCLVTFYVVLEKTRYGRSLRACSDDRQAAALMGVPVRRLAMTTFLVGAALAGVAGWIILTLGTISAFVGASFVLRGFAVALVGGLGNIRGAAVAGIGLGVAEGLAVGYGDPAWSEFYVFVLVIVVLLWRPTGLFGGVSGARL